MQNKFIRKIVAPILLLAFNATWLPAAMGTPTSRLVGDGEIADFSIETTEKAVLLYLAHKPGNEPFVKAKISIQLAGQEKTIPFEETTSPGIYRLNGPAPDFDKAQIIVEAAEDTDLIDIASLESKPPGAVAAAVVKVPTNNFSLTGIFMFILGVAVGAGAFFTASRLSMRRLARSKTALLIFFCLTAKLTFNPRNAFAHGGHDHGDATTEVQNETGSAITLAKKSQFLIGLTAIQARVEDITNSFVSYGHIIAKPTQDTYILAPQAGFLRGSQNLVLGQMVTKGQNLATIESVGHVNLTAPFDGQVLEIITAEGSRVEAGAKLFRVTNPMTVWVDAELYESDLAHFKEIVSAEVGTTGEVQSFPAKVLNFMTPINEETRTAKTFLELDNSAGKLRLGSFVTIHFGLSSQSKGIVLPVSALVTRSGEEVVFVQTGPESFEGRSVVTAKGPKPGTVVVSSGVKDGDRVVVTGSYQLLMKAR